MTTKTQEEALLSALEQLMARIGERGDCGELLSRIDGLREAVRGTADRQLLHYLDQRSYQKAILFLRGNDGENARGLCGR